MAEKKVFDCLIFYNEFDLLELRLRELASVVDYFVICEATKTFQGKPKELNFLQNSGRFSEYSEKIIHVVVDDMPAEASTGSKSVGAGDDPTTWKREHFQRNAIRRGLRSAKPDDVIIVADCDEIVSPEAIAVLRRKSGYFLLDMAMYQFYFNMCAQEAGWRKPFAYSYHLDTLVGDFNAVRTSEIASFERFSPNHHYLKSAGWHFTFLGGATQVSEKLSAYSHTSGWQRSMWSRATLDEQMVALREVGGGKILRYKQIDQTFPTSLVKHIDEYIQRGLVKGQFSRLKELEDLWAEADKKQRQLVELDKEMWRRLMLVESVAKENGIDVFSWRNLIPASQTFAELWNGGVQLERAGLSNNVPSYREGNATMRHSRSDPLYASDNNVGYFTRLPISAGLFYTASCFIWLDEEYAGNALSLFIDNWPEQVRGEADARIRGRWQRIASTCRAPNGETGCNVVLRLSSDITTVAYSCCWQFECGTIASDYIESLI